MMEGPAVVLLSIGRNPVSGRPRRAARDARAVSMALDVGVPVIGIHAGPGSDVLGDYFGMGLAQLIHLVLPESLDPIGVLHSQIEALGPSLVFAGTRAEIGEGSGIVPYEVARRLSLPLVPQVVSVSKNDEKLQLLQALPGARRRCLKTNRSVLVTVDSHGPPLRQIARGPARRREIQRLERPESFPSLNLLPACLSERPARPRPKRIGPATAAKGVNGRQTLVNPDAETAAHEILRFLEAERIITPPIRTDHSLEESAHDDSRRSSQASQD